MTDVVGTVSAVSSLVSFIGGVLRILEKIQSADKRIQAYLRNIEAIKIQIEFIQRLWENDNGGLNGTSPIKGSKNIQDGLNWLENEIKNMKAILENVVHAGGQVQRGFRMVMNEREIMEIQQSIDRIQKHLQILLQT
jgi:hypothetical protein